MTVEIERRAEIALRSLDSEDQKRVLRVLDILAKFGREELQRSRKLQKLNIPAIGLAYFLYRASPRLRVIVSFSEDVCTVEDILDHDKIERFTKGKGLA